MNLNLSDPEVLELSALCSALLDGAITDAERARLEAWLADSEAARFYYVRTLALSASLCDYANEMQSEAPDLETRIIRPPVWRWTAAALATAAGLALAFWWPTPMSETRPGNPLAEAGNDETIARLSGARDVQWLGEKQTTGEELRAGQQLQIGAGFAEITFDSGARVTLEGPAAVVLNSAWEATLRHGTLRASVPAEAIGFRMSNPDVDVVDRGAEFTLVADDRGVTEVYVQEGAVEVPPRQAGGREPVILRARQARRFAQSGASETVQRNPQVDRFIHKVALDRLTRPTAYVRWSFDEAPGGGALRAETFGAARGTYDLLLPTNAPRVPGRWNRALDCDGSFGAHAAFAGLGQRRPRTVAFWVRSPSEVQLPASGPLLAWQLQGKDPRAIEVAWNRQPTKGPLGALSTRVGRGLFVGSTPVRDGRWHHVAVVFLPKQKPEGGAQIKHYVDGRLDTVTWSHLGRKASGELADPPPTGEETLWLGQGMGTGAERFRGQLDEVFLADRALTPQEIRYLMNHNAPAPLEMLAAE